MQYILKIMLKIFQYTLFILPTVLCAYKNQCGNTGQNGLPTGRQCFVLIKGKESNS